MSEILISSICSRELTTVTDFEPLIFIASASFGTKALSKTPRSVLEALAGLVRGPKTLNMVFSLILFLMGIINFIAG